MELRQRRLEKGWSQQQLADISGVSARTIQRLEKGETPSIESLKAFASVFEVPLSDLHVELNVDSNSAKKETPMPNTIGQPSGESGDTSETLIPKSWRGFFLHLLTAMFVLTWLLILSSIFSIDRGLIYVIGFAWAFVLVIQAWNKANPDHEGEED